MRHTNRILGSAVVVGLLLGGSAWTSRVLAQGTYVATASVKATTGTGTVTAPVTVVVTRLTTDQERDSVGAALKKGGSAAVVQTLKAMPDVGYIEVGERRTPLKYAYMRPIGGGRLLTVVAPTPIIHLGSALPDAKPKAGFDLALALLQLMDAGPGTGELAPAATIRLNEQGAIQTQDYGTDMVRLSNVMIKK
jgi:hypothetical protein